MTTLPTKSPLHTSRAYHSIPRRSMRFFITLALGRVLAQNEACQLNFTEPLTWPSRHTHREAQFSPRDGSISNKLVYYDFPRNRLRYDITYESGPRIPFITLLNFSSLWLGDTLYMITWEAVDDPTPSCVALNMGFGMMFPDWFKRRGDGDDAFQVGTQWLSHKSDGADPGYHLTLWTTKMSPDGAFNYYSYLNDTGYPPREGHGFAMSAMIEPPVVNEYFDFAPVDSFPDSLFDLPATPICRNSTLSAAPRSWDEFRAALGRRAPPLAEFFVGR